MIYMIKNMNMIKYKTDIIYFLMIQKYNLSNFINDLKEKIYLVL